MNRAISKTSILILIFTFLSCAKSFNKDSILGTWYSVEVINGGESIQEGNVRLALTIDINNSLILSDASNNDTLTKMTYSISEIDPERKVILLDVNTGKKTERLMFTLSNDTLSMENGGEESSSRAISRLSFIKKLK